MDPFTWTHHGLTVDGVALDVATMHREGTKHPILLLHGFGSTKEDDYADITRHGVLDGHSVLAYDAPGCGETACADLAAISIPFLVHTALAMLDGLGVGRFHLVGHSMGGLTALMLASRQHERALSFVDIEGNVAPEDCFSAARSSPTRPTTMRRSSRISSTATGARRRTPARCSPRACATRSAPARSAGSSSRWSTCQITATS